MTEETYTKKWRLTGRALEFARDLQQTVLSGQQKLKDMAFSNAVADTEMALRHKREVEGFKARHIRETKQFSHDHDLKLLKSIEDNNEIRRIATIALFDELGMEAHLGTLAHFAITQDDLHLFYQGPTKPPKLPYPVVKPKRDIGD